MKLPNKPKMLMSEFNFQKFQNMQFFNKHFEKQLSLLILIVKKYRDRKSNVGVGWNNVLIYILNLTQTCTAVYTWIA